MPKRVAVIDIGSNSARVVIYQRTSRFGFHLIAQQKASLRISEGSFENGGYLQEKAIQKAISTLAAFKEIINDYKARKTLIIATAAVRNAPNRYEFLKRVKEATSLKIKVIDGNKEAYYAALAAKNLLPIKKHSSYISVDIGGGSSDIALIKDNKIVSTISLNIGTITIKELFFDKGKTLEEAKEFIQQELSKIPAEFKADYIIAIGGVLRAFAKAIMNYTDYSFKKIHSFEYNFKEQKEFIEKILNAKKHKELEKLFIKQNRFDTIKEGLIIFQALLEKFQSYNVITSAVGVREGVFLHDMLRNSKGSFPKELNPSIVSILDRFDILALKLTNKLKSAKKLFEIFEQEGYLEAKYKKLLLDAVKISNIGKYLTIYEEHKHAYYIASAELNWQYTHEEMLLIATILRSKGYKLIYKPLKKEHKDILPSKSEIKWLGFIYTLSDILFSYSSKYQYDFEYKNEELIIYSPKELPLFETEKEKLQAPKELTIKVVVAS